MKINFIYDPNVNFAQMIGYEIAALMWGQLFTDDIEVNIFAQGTDSLDSNGTLTKNWVQKGVKA